MKKKTKKVLSLFLTAMLSFGVSSVLITTFNKLDDKKPAVEEEIKEPVVFLDGYVIENKALKGEPVGYFKFPEGLQTNPFCDNVNYITELPTGVYFNNFSIEYHSTPAGVFDTYVLKGSEVVQDHTLVNFIVNQKQILDINVQVFAFAENYYLPVSEDFFEESQIISSLDELEYYSLEDWSSCADINFGSAAMCDSQFVSYHDEDDYCCLDEQFPSKYTCLHSGPLGFEGNLVFYKI